MVPFFAVASKSIFDKLCNPSNTKFTWIVDKERQVIFLNDFRYDSSTIAWKDLLLLLEGQTVNLLTPNNLFSKDICIGSDVTVFATGKSKINCQGKHNTTDFVENEMMLVGWKRFRFYHQIA